MQPPIPALKGRFGFTLIEVMIAVSILALLLILFSQLIGNVSKLTAQGRQRLDSDAAARIALDLIASDLGARLRRPDADFLIEKSSGSDAFFFHSEAPAFLGSGTADTVALIGYRVSGTNGLERIGMGYPMGSGSFALPTRLSTIVNTLPETAFQPLCKEVFRMEIEFMKRDGNFIDKPPTRAAAGKPAYTYISNSGSLVQISASQLDDWDDICAMVITIACLDRDQQKLLSDTELTALAEAFQDAPASSNTRPGTFPWGERAEKASFDLRAKSASGAVRVYRRFIPLQ